ncbi:swarming motility protein YbiA [Acrasis kona]|uniref:Swarming motility protein YbiA n=1 Tax=Acrasis kona TaxID=1008807 RepID=A0AAW2YW25_9EUKA
MGGPALIDGRLVNATDNFHKANFVVDGISYCSSENYFQCVKCIDSEEREHVRMSGPDWGAWRAGSTVKLRPDWEKIKVRTMYTGCKSKYKQNPDLKAELTSTKGEIKFNASATFWCLWNEKITTLLREELKEPDQRNEAIINDIWHQIQKYEEQNDLVTCDG